MEGPDGQRQPMASNLTGQVRNIAEVTTAVANGDLTKKVTVDVSGEILRAEGNAVNTMVDQLRAFSGGGDTGGAGGRHRGPAGRSGRRARGGRRPGRTSPTASTHGRQPHGAGSQYRGGHDGGRRRRLAAQDPGRCPRRRSCELKDTINTMVEPAQRLRGGGDTRRAGGRHRGAAGRAGRWCGGRGYLEGPADSVNSMAANLTAQVRNIAEVTTAVARGDSSRKVTGGCTRRRCLQLKRHHQHHGGSAQRVRLGGDTRRAGSGHRGEAGRAGEVAGSGGTWKELTDNVNSMASNLTAQVREHRGGRDRGRERRLVEEDHRRRARRDPAAEGHHQHNGRSARVLRSRGDTRGARGGHRGQDSAGRRWFRASAGTWKDLTDNVNLMAANLTRQVRNIAEVTTAVARGDLSRRSPCDV